MTITLIAGGLYLLYKFSNVLASCMESNDKTINNYYIDTMECQGDMNNYESEININTYIEDSDE